MENDRLLPKIVKVEGPVVKEEILEELESAMKNTDTLTHLFFLNDNLKQELSMVDGCTYSTNLKNGAEKSREMSGFLVEENNLRFKQPVQLSNEFLENLSENIKDESQEILFQVEMQNEDCDNFIEEIELPLEQPQRAGNDLRSRVSSAMIDHDYVSAELSSHISLMARIKTCDDMAKFLAMFSEFTSDFTPDHNFSSKKEEIKCYVNELQEKARELRVKIDAIESEEYSCDKIITSENKVEKSKSIFPEGNSKLNCNSDYDSGEDERFDSRTLGQNCSEPLEFERPNIPNDKQNNEIFNGVTEQNENQVRLHRIAEIGKDISKISKAIMQDENCHTENDLKRLFVELKNCLFFSKTVAVQADFGKQVDLESNDKRLNEKEKRKLLSRLSSSSDTDSSRDEDENYSNKSSNSYMSSNRGSMISKPSDDEDENNNHDTDFSLDDEKEPQSLDLSSYIAKEYCESQFDSRKNTDVTMEQDNLNDVYGERFSKVDRLEEQNCDSTTRDKLDVKQIATDLEGRKSVEDSQDKVIDKLLDFSNIMKKNPQKVQCEYSVPSEKEKRKSAKIESIYSLTNDVEKYISTDESSSEEESERITEREFLEKYNNGCKHKLLNTSSSDSEQVSDVSDVDALLENISSSDTEKETNKKTEKEPVQKPNILELSDLSQKNECFDSIPSLLANVQKKDVENNNIDSKDIAKENSPTEVREGKESSEYQLSLLPTENLSSNEKTKKNSLLNREDSETSDCEILNAKGKPKENIKTEDSNENPLNSDYTHKRCKSIDNSIDVSSDTESDITNEENSEEVEKTKRTIKPMLRQDQLAGETKKAQQNEDQRLKRLKKKRELLSKMMKEHKESLGNSENNLILDFNSITKKFIKVHPELAAKLKPHQIEGVKFMYDAVFGSVDNLHKYPGSGCILAHCMGLGKTLQLIALLHTVISYKELNTSKVLVLCPKSTVMNWIDEIKFWLDPLNCKDLRLYKFESREYSEKLRILKDWSSCGKPGFRKVGCLLIGYEAFRMLASCHNHKKQRDNLSPKELQNMEEDINKTLFDPGPDLVICDEGHIIKNRKSATSAAVLKLKTPRRIILTGTPIQNNLKEYYSMVNFIKPSFLGTEREFANLYANPIKNGQHKDSNKLDIKIMKQRSFVLHKKLSEFVQRKEAALLKTFLPEKYEYVLFIPMTEVQIQLYEYFLQTVAKRDDSRGKNLITDYTCLRKIWTHPKVLENAWQNANAKSRSSVKTNNSDDEAPDDVLDSQTGFLSVKRDWWRHLICPDDLVSILPSNKLRIVFEILRLCQETNEKCLIFSAFVAVLNVLEYFLKQIGKDGVAKEGIKGCQIQGPWVEGRDFYRLDGKTSKNRRHEMIKNFNKPNNPARCFLISARAGGQGINLIGANRVILLDTSWNPSNDQQNIFRIFRLGQMKKCYVYRLLAMGTMEEKVYSRSVTKQAMSFRVVDEQQIDRHYSMAELAELYSLTKPDFKEREVPKLPQDSFLASLLRNYPNLIYKYHEHDSLLENKVEQELSEQEKQDAWAAYEKDLQQSQNPPGVFPSPFDSLQNSVLGHNAANYFSSLSHLNYNNYALNPANLLPWSSIEYTNSALASFYSMYQGLQPGSSPLLSNQNLLNMQPQFSNNVLSSDSSSRPFSCLGPYGAITSNTPNSNTISSGMFSAIPSLQTFATKNSSSESPNSSRYYSNSAFGTQISSTGTNNANIEPRVQNQHPGLQSALNIKTVSSNVTTCTVTVSNTAPITTDATKTSSNLNSKDQKTNMLEISNLKTGTRSDPTTFLSSTSDIQITNVAQKPSSANSIGAVEVSRGTKSSNMGIVYAPLDHSHTKSPNSKISSNSFLTSKLVDLTPSNQGGNITVRSVSAINKGSANKTMSTHMTKGLGNLGKKLQKTVKTSIVNVDRDSKRTTSKEVAATKLSIISNNSSTAAISSSPIVVSSSTAVQNPSSLIVTSLPTSMPSKTLVKRINTTPQVTNTLNSGMVISSSPILASLKPTKSNETKLSASSSVKALTTDSMMQKRSKIISETSMNKTTGKLISKINQLEKSVFPQSNVKASNVVKSSPQPVAVDECSINTKQYISNHATGPVQMHAVTSKQPNSSGFVRVVNLPTSNNSFKHIEKSNKSEGILRNVASVRAKSPLLFNKMSEISNVVGKKSEISVRSVEKLNKLTNHGLIASHSRKINSSTPSQNALNASHSFTWNADASRKRALPTASSILTEGSFSIQRKKPRLMDVSVNNENSKVQLSQGAHVKKDVHLGQRSSAVSVKPPEVVEID